MKKQMDAKVIKNQPGAIESKESRDMAKLKMMSEFEKLMEFDDINMPQLRKDMIWAMAVEAPYDYCMNLSFSKPLTKNESRNHLTDILIRMSRCINSCPVKKHLGGFATETVNNFNGTQLYNYYLMFKREHNLTRENHNNIMQKLKYILSECQAVYDKKTYQNYQSICDIKLIPIPNDTVSNYYNIIKRMTMQISNNESDTNYICKIEPYVCRDFSSFSYQIHKQFY